MFEDDVGVGTAARSADCSNEALHLLQIRRSVGGTEGEVPSIDHGGRTKAQTELGALVGGTIAIARTGARQGLGPSIQGRPQRPNENRLASTETALGAQASDTP